MSWHPLLDLAGALAGRGGERKAGSILVIRRNRMGDMICTLPLLHAIREQYPEAYLAVACDGPGVPIAEACPAVNEVILLNNKRVSFFDYPEINRMSRSFETVVAAKGGFDRRLAAMTRISGAPVRIGFAGPDDDGGYYYTKPVALPPRGEHQVETLLRLGKPLGINEVTRTCYDLKLSDSAVNFGEQWMLEPPFSRAERLVLINISSTAPVKFGDEDFVELARRAAAHGAVAFVAAPEDQAKARTLAEKAGAERVVAVATPGPMELAALLVRAAVLVTPEGGAAHLATVTDTPAVVLWSEGPFEKWRSRGENHQFVQAEAGETKLPLERVWPAVESVLLK